ncbi:MAG: dihydrodipicolinate synthase family protein [Rhodospirillaceae bacterium]|nr:dihydrodipicolinate synthase family protein [Rhodospirillaceae bacterium]
MVELRGVIPPATTPFRDDDEIDHTLVRRQIDWLISAGARGIAVGGSTGEGHTLELGEYTALVETAIDAASERVPIIAGIITDSTRDAIKRGKAVKHMGAAALQVTPVHYLFRPDDDSMIEHFRVMAAETEMPIIIYNVVPWTYLSPTLLLRIMKEVPDVIGVKQSAGDLKLMADLVMDARPEDHIFSAVDALMYPSYSLGCRGSIAAILTAAPHASVALWDAVEVEDHARALELHTRLLRLWNAMVSDNLPACTKYAQSLQGCPTGRPRAPMPEASDKQKVAIRSALASLDVRMEAAE